MKTLVLLLTVCIGLVRASAQGTVEFFADLTGVQEVPPNNSANHASGTFHLRNDGFFEWGVALDAPWFEDTGGFVHGPAPRGVVAPPLFDLGNRFIVGPSPGNPGGVVYGGNRTLTSSEVSDLLAGLWYVSITSDTYPNGEVRGQITVVPEPSTAGLLLAGTLLFWFCGRKKRMA